MKKRKRWIKLNLFWFILDCIFTKAKVKIELELYEFEPNKYEEFGMKGNKGQYKIHLSSI